MSTQCDSMGANYKQERTTKLNNYIQDVKSMINQAETSDSWNNLNDIQKEQRLVSIKSSDGKSINTIINEINNDNLKSEEQLQKLKHNQSNNMNVIEENSNKLKNLEKHISEKTMNEKIAKQKMDNIQSQSKNVNFWYLFLLISLLIVLSVELGIIVFSLKNSY